MTNHTATKDAKCYFCDFKGRHDSVKRHMRTNHANAVPAGHRPFNRNPKILLREQTHSVRDNTTKEMVDVVQFPDGICTGCYTRISNIREDEWKKLVDGTMSAFRNHLCKPKQQRAAREVTLMASPKAPKAAAKKETDNDDYHDVIEKAVADAGEDIFNDIHDGLDASGLPPKQIESYRSLLAANTIVDDNGVINYRESIKGYVMDIVSQNASTHH